MFIPSIFDPSHCTQDLLFSLLPMVYNGKLRDYQAVAVTRPDTSKEYHARNYTGDYCTLVLKALGWFQNMTVLPNNTCFDEVSIPAFMYHRFPRGWDEKAGKSATDYFYNGNLPLQVMTFYQQQMWRSFLASNKYLYRGKKKRIIFDTRASMFTGDWGKGEWTNANEIAKLIREQLDPEMYTVEIIGDVGALTLQEQAALYQSAAILVAPQGFTLANIVFMRPNSIIYEISCGESSWVRDWAIDLKLRHAIVRADEPPCNVEGHKTLPILNLLN